MSKTAYCHETEAMGLRPIERQDLELLRSWRNGDDTRKWFKYSEKIDSKSQEKWFDSYMSNDKDFYYIVEWKVHNQPVGAIGFTETPDGEYEVGRVIIAEKYRGKGLGHQSVQLLLDYMFNKLQLPEVFLEVYKDNQRAVKVYEAGGFEVVDEYQYEDKLMVKMVAKA